MLTNIYCLFTVIVAHLLNGRHLNILTYLMFIRIQLTCFTNDKTEAQKG